MDSKFFTEEYTPVYGITHFSLLDYPGKVSCIIWIAGCNMRCGYCHNPDIVKSKGKMSFQKALDFLEKRKNMIDAAVISGGEATMAPGVFEFIVKIKKLGFLVKLDTNGTNPKLVSDLISNSLVNFISLDYKAPKEKYKKITGLNDFSKFSKTLDLLCNKFLHNFEVRTTVHTDLIDETDINKIITDLEKRRYRSNYYIQNFNFNENYPNLGNLQKQIRVIDKKYIKLSEEVNICFRNF